MDTTSENHDERLPGEGLDHSRMPGHWLLAQMGKRVLRPGGLELTHEMLARLDIGDSDDVVEFAPGLGLTARAALERNPASYIGVERTRTQPVRCVATSTDRLGNAWSAGPKQPDCPMVPRRWCSAKRCCRCRQPCTKRQSWRRPRVCSNPVGAMVSTSCALYPTTWRKAGNRRSVRRCHKASMLVHDPLRPENGRACLKSTVSPSTRLPRHPCTCWNRVGLYGTRDRRGVSDLSGD